MHASRSNRIQSWILRIEKSELGTRSFFRNHQVPFSLSQYYLYKDKIEKHGEEALKDQRAIGGNRKISVKDEMFLKGLVKSNPSISLNEIQIELKRECACEITVSGVSRIVKRIFPNAGYSPKAERPKLSIKNETNEMGGFEIIVALAYHLRIPETVSGIILNEVEAIKRKKVFKKNGWNTNHESRSNTGRFTSKYNQNDSVLAIRFSSIEEKKKNVDWSSMSIFRDSPQTLSRKTMSIISLPLVTSNGNVRSVNLAHGQLLKHFCGFNYKQGTLDKYLKEIKYLGVSDKLLKELSHFWFTVWGQHASFRNNTFVCYYIDGNTKALWSTGRVKKNKVTMLGRVMGCLEQVFIHDGKGNPIYFETFSGRGPTGEKILDMFGKIEDVILNVPKSQTKIRRAIVMDSAGNSVSTLRSFIKQKKYYYITPLDDNQWKESNVMAIGRARRYTGGNADLYEVLYRMEDSKEKGYFLSSRAIKIDWDNGKKQFY